MSLPKAQLVDPQGNMNLPGMTATGVVTATSLKGDIAGSATALTGNPDLDVGIVTASSFVGQGDGHAANITGTPQLNLGITTATSFVGDAVGKAAGLTGTPNLNVGLITATGFVGFVTGNVTGDVTGNITGLAGSVASGANIHIGVITATSYSGDGQYLTGIAATNYNTQVIPDNKTFSIDVGNSGSSAYTLSGTDRNGSVSGNNASVSVEIGDTLNFVVDASGHPFYIRVSDGGANVSTPSATNQGAQSGTVSWTPNTAGTYYYQCGNHSGMIGTITVTATTTIDLSAGNVITFNQSASTTIGFANTDTAMDITIIRDKDDNSTVRTITWPDSVQWDGGSAPDLGQTSSSKTFQQFQFITRDAGVNWYGWQNAGYAPITGFFAVGQGGGTGVPGQNNNANISSPAQIPGTTWVRGAISHQNAIAVKSDGTLWGWGDNSEGEGGQNDTTQRSSPMQIGSRNAWNVGELSLAGSRSGAFWAVDTSNQLWAWGNSLGSASLGLGNVGPSGSRSSPCQIPGSWSKPFASYQGAFGAIKNSNELWVWGNNEEGGLGQNNRTQYSSPKQVPGAWSQASGGNHNFGGIKTDGTLWTCGRNSSGMLGINQPTNSHRSSPVQVGTDTTWKELTGRIGFGFHAIKTDGTMWAWGTNTQGNLGDNTTVSKSSPVQIAGTTWDTFSTKCIGNKIAGALKTDGTLWSWGYSPWGVLGQNTAYPGPNSSFSSPTQVGSFVASSFALGNFNMTYVREIDTLS